MRSALSAFVVAAVAATSPAHAQSPEPAAPATAPMEFKIEGGQLVLPGPVVFETGSDKLAAASDGVVKFIAAFLAAKDSITLVRLEGHTDNEGEANAKVSLSLARALAVGRALVAQGTDCKRLIVVGFGDFKPVAANDTPENRALNRRIDVRPATLRGRPIGGMPVDGGAPTVGDVCSK